MIYKLVRTRNNHYISSVLQSLFVAIHKNVRLVNNVDPQDDDNKDILYIITFCQNVARMPKRYIVYQLEQMHLTQYNQDDDYRAKLLHAEQCWDYNRNNIEKYQSKNIIYFPVPIAHLPTTFLSSYPQGQERIDILFYGTLNTRRYNIIAFLYTKLRPYNICVKFVHQLFGENLYTYIRRSRIVLNIGYYSNTLLATYRLNEILVHQRVAFSEKSIHASESNVIEEYKKAGVIFFSKITDTLHNIEIELVRPLAQLLYNKKQYDHLIQQGQQFVIAKERESQDVLKKMDL